MWEGELVWRNGTCLRDAVVVCQEHGEVLGLLDRLGVCHLPQKLGSSGRKKYGITKAPAHRVHALTTHLPHLTSPAAAGLQPQSPPAI